MPYSIYYNIEGHTDSLSGPGQKARSTTLKSAISMGFTEVRLQDGYLQAGSLHLQQVPANTRCGWNWGGKEAGPCSYVTNCLKKGV